MVFFNRYTTGYYQVVTQICEVKLSYNVMTIHQLCQSLHTQLVKVANTELV